MSRVETVKIPSSDQYDDDDSGGGRGQNPLVMIHECLRGRYLLAFALMIVGGLMGAAVSNLETGRPHDVLTGPIARGDVASVQGHLAALADDSPALAAYVTLSRAALTLARERGTSAERLAEISAALDEASATA